MMKIKTSVTDKVLAFPNPFNIPAADVGKYDEVVVRAYIKDGNSFTMSFPREKSKFKRNSPTVIAAIQKALDTCTKSMVNFLNNREAKKETKTAQ